MEKELKKMLVVNTLMAMQEQTQSQNQTFEDREGEAKLVYNEWLGNKKQAESQGKIQKMQKLYDEEMKKESKKQQAEQSYDIWL